MTLRTKWSENLLVIKTVRKSQMTLRIKHLTGLLSPGTWVNQIQILYEKDSIILDIKLFLQLIFQIRSPAHKRNQAHEKAT